MATGSTRRTGRMQTRWGLIVEENDGMGERKAWATTVLAHFDGTREQALVKLEEYARNYSPQHPASASPRAFTALRRAASCW